MSGISNKANAAHGGVTRRGRRSPAACVVASAFATLVVFDFARSQPAQQTAPRPPAAPAAQAPAAKPYTPGLAEFMLAVQAHHTKLWLAARARNWPLAAYQLEEMKELLEDVEERVPVYKEIPVGKMIEAIAAGPVSALEKAVEAKSFKNFSSAYGTLTAACNDCHKAAKRGFIVIRTPVRSPYPNQEFRPQRR